MSDLLTLYQECRRRGLNVIGLDGWTDWQWRVNLQLALRMRLEIPLLRLAAPYRCSGTR